MDAGLVRVREHQEYMVPNETGVGCQRCLIKGLPCDKPGRGGVDDPCSECRWFGGEHCRRELSVDSSYNDELWGVMMSGRDRGYTLPRRARTETKSGKLPPQPMLQANLKADWSGETSVALLMKADSIPLYVCGNPRAYMVPPRRGALGMLGLERQMARRGGNADPESSTTEHPPSPGRPRWWPRPLQYRRPQGTPDLGRPRGMFWDFDEDRWEVHYQSTTIVQRDSEKERRAQLVPPQGSTSPLGIPPLMLDTTVYSDEEYEPSNADDEHVDDDD